MLYFIIILVQAVIFGFATKIVIENKGYYENWFWWGFFFGIIALIVACAKPQIDYYSNYSGSSHSSQSGFINYPDSQGSTLSISTNNNHNAQLLAAGGWKCSCGKVQASYVSSCSCGRNKYDVLNAQRKKEREEEKKEEPQKEEKAQHKEAQNDAQMTDELRKVEAIRKYKELMDEAIISKEEFEAKKKQLLGL